MPKKPRLNVRLAPELTEERPVRPSLTPLVMEERDRLTQILNDPVFIKAWNNAEAKKPSAFPSMNNHFEGEHGAKHASNALHRIQGWEMHKAALIIQTKEVIPMKPKTNEEYPDAGTLEAEVKKHLPITPKR